MRLLTAAGLLVFTAGTALPAYLVELDGGDRMTVDSYWVEGDRMHLMRGGVDLSVPKSRVRRLTEASGAEDAGVGQMPATPPPAAPRSTSATDEGDREELEAKQRRIEHHILRVQQERFEARARGDDPKTLRRLDKEFKRTQQRRRDVIRAIGEPIS